MTTCPHCKQDALIPYAYRYEGWHRTPQPPDDEHDADGRKLSKREMRQRRREPIPTESDRYQFTPATCFNGIEKTAHICVESCMKPGLFCQNCRALS